MASKKYTAEGMRMHACYLRRDHNDEAGAEMLEQAAEMLEREERREKKYEYDERLTIVANYEAVVAYKDRQIASLRNALRDIVLATSPRGFSKSERVIRRTALDALGFATVAEMLRADFDHNTK